MCRCGDSSILIRKASVRASSSDASPVSFQTRPKATFSVPAISWLERRCQAIHPTTPAAISAAAIPIASESRILGKPTIRLDGKTCWLIKTNSSRSGSVSGDKTDGKVFTSAIAPGVSERNSADVATDSTGARKRYPRRAIVSRYNGCDALSRSASRSLAAATRRLLSNSTNVFSPHSRLRSSSRVTISPAESSSTTSMRRGRSWMRTREPFLRRSPASGQASNSPKRRRRPARGLSLAGEKLDQEFRRYVAPAIRHHSNG